MHFSSTAALVALSSLGVTYAAPFPNSQDDLGRRQINYQVVNVGGDPATPEIKVVTETVKSVTTASGVPAAPETVTVTATPSSVIYKSGAPSSTPRLHDAPPSGASFFPPTESSSFFRRGLKAAGDPFHYARSLAPSASSASLATSTAVLAERGTYGWYTPSGAPSSSVSVPTSLHARQFGSWVSSAPPSVPTSSGSPVYARGFEGWYTTSGTPSSSVSVPTSLAARQFDSRGPNAPVPSVSTSFAAPSAASLARRDFASASSTPSSSVVARGYHYSSPSSSATPSSSISSPLSAAAVLF
ncbi:uncharacterized protein N7459_004289 [Penicillium hispanicum]|uniref:uncharacterized protein n=1 Tax=Penicillium hispanicum TaxID=1080232 RepID=UPI0025418A4B|nr:uncharacterized protein N7459_004289 [Penicillium hispanicum]KAJ5584489.1 hypothetical protein N7459_004289 [Penicillium hispanicum]